MGDTGRRHAQGVRERGKARASGPFPDLVKWGEVLAGAGTRLARLRAKQWASQVDPQVGPEAFWRAFRMELERARRRERPLALLRFELEPQSPTRGVELLGSMAASLRVMDAITYEQRQIVVLLSDADPQSAIATARRLQVRADRHNLALRSIAVFPDDGLTTSSLIDTLYSSRSVDQYLHSVAAGAA